VYGLHSQQAFMPSNVVWSCFRKHGVKLMVVRWSCCTTSMRFLSTSHFCRILSMKKLRVLCVVLWSFYQLIISPTVMLSHINSYNYFQPVRWPIAMVYLAYHLRHRYYHDNADVITDQLNMIMLTYFDLLHDGICYFP